MNERQHRDSLLNNQRVGTGPITKYEQDLSGDGKSDSQYDALDSQLSLEQLEARDASVYDDGETDLESLDDQEQLALGVDKSSLLDIADEMGLVYEEIGNSVQDLSIRLSDLSNPTSESIAWWQSLLNHVPYLGGLIEPDSGRMLLNLGDDGYILLTGDTQSLDSYIIEMSKHSGNTSFFWNFPLLIGLEQEVVREAETIMIGTRSYDLKSFLDEAKAGSVDINSYETEAVPLLNWMALQAGEQSTDIEENENANPSDLVFAAAISKDTIFTDSSSSGKADRLVDSIKSIYSLVETAPVTEQRNLEEMLDDELLDIIDDENRWGLTDNDLVRMVDNIERLEQDYQNQIERLLIEETKTEEIG